MRSALNPLAKFRRLAPADRRLLLEAAVVLGIVRLRLWLRPAGRAGGSIGRTTPVSARASHGSAAGVSRAGWAVATAARPLPGATCLAQALAAQVLLARRGVPSRVQIGVACPAPGAFAAHAWLESEGRVVIGGPAAGFTPLGPRQDRVA